MVVTWKNIGPIDNIPVRGARRLAIGINGRPIAVFRTGDGTFFALVDECPHKQGPLSEGIVSADSVTCPLHNWTICLRDGMAMAPDEGCTQVLPLRVVDSEIHIGLIEAESAAA